MKQGLLRVLNRVVVVLVLACVIGACGTLTSHAVENPAITLNITHGENIKCGEETQFTLSVSDGQGPYKYGFYSLLRKEDGVWTNVVDSTKYGFTKEIDGEYIFKFTFYSSGEYQLKFQAMDLGTTPVGIGITSINFTVNDSKYPSAEQKADSIAAECKAKNFRTDYDKALWLHDWLIDNCEYDYSFLYCSAEGALCRGTGTCEAYQRAYSMLLNRMGIENTRVESKTERHTWNGVKMDGQWYYVDCTHDDPAWTGFDNHLYFGLNNEILSLNASGIEEVNASHKYEALEDNYFIKSGDIATWSDPEKVKVQNGLDAEKTDFSIDVSTPWESTPSYNNIIYNLVAYDLSTQDWSSKGKNYTVEAVYSDKKISVKATEKSSEPEPCQHNFSTIWTTDADYHWHVCKNDGCNEVSEKNKHNWGEWKSTKAASCTEAGSETRTCATCKKMETREIPVKNHIMVYVTDVPSGYMQHGSAHYQCSLCGARSASVHLEGYSTSYVKSFKVKKGKKCFTAKWKKQSKKNLKAFSGYQLRYTMSGNPDDGSAIYVDVGKKKSSRKIKGAAKTRYYVQVRTYTDAAGGRYYSPWSGVKSVVTK